MPNFCINDHSLVPDMTLTLKMGGKRTPAASRPRSAMAVLLGLGSSYLGSRSYQELSSLLVCILTVIREKLNCW